MVPDPYENLRGRIIKLGEMKVSMKAPSGRPMILFDGEGETPTELENILIDIIGLLEMESEKRTELINDRIKFDKKLYEIENKLNELNKKFSKPKN